MSKLLVTTSPV